MKPFLFLILLSQELTFAGNQILTYEPSTVELVGTLDLQTFPGPPNFDSIKNGDDIERHFYLNLDQPIDVLPKGEHPEVDNPEEERNVKIVQLAIDGENEKLWARFRKVGEGGRVRINGTLFHRFTGHHHSRILLAVNSMEPLKL